MKYALLGLVALFTVAGCADLDRYVPRTLQCQLLEVAAARAAEEGLSVEQYIDVNQIFVCADVEDEELEVVE